MRKTKIMVEDHHSNDSGWQEDYFRPTNRLPEKAKLLSGSTAISELLYESLFSANHNLVFLCCEHHSLCKMNSKLHSAVGICLHLRASLMSTSGLELASNLNRNKVNRLRINFYRDQIAVYRVAYYVVCVPPKTITIS